MCIRFGPQKMGVMGAPPPVEGRVDTSSSDLPAQKDVVKPDDKSGVQYGSSKKESGAAAATKSGAASLKIPLNVGQQGSNTGGLNV